jgi:hypothetical protein
MKGDAARDEVRLELRVKELTVERSALFEKASIGSGLSTRDQQRLHSIERELDEFFVTRRRQRAARELHRFAPDGIARRRAVRADETPSAKAPRMVRYLTRVGEHAPFAYAVNRRDFLLVSDQTLWAHESQDWLVAADSGAALAHRTGDSYYSVDNGEPLFKQTALPYLG